MTNATPVPDDEREIADFLRSVIDALRDENRKQRNTLSAAALIMDSLLGLDTIPQDIREGMTAVIARIHA